MKAQRKPRTGSRQAPQYPASRESDGMGDVFLICDAAAGRATDSACFWGDDPEWETRAEEEARRIVRELELHGPRHVRAYDDVA